MTKLLAHYPLELIDVNVPDISGNKYHAQLSSFVYQEPRPLGKINYCYDFTGQTLTFPPELVDMINFHSSNISFWYFDNLSQSGSLFRFNGGMMDDQICLGQCYLDFRIKPGQSNIELDLFLLISGQLPIGLSISRLDLNNIIKENNWNHVSLNFNRKTNEISIYLNGSYIDTFNTENTLLFDNIEITSDFSGRIDDIKFFEGLLSLKEIQLQKRALVTHLLLNQPDTNVYDSSGYDVQFTNQSLWPNSVQNDNPVGDNSKIFIELPSRKEIYIENKLKGQGVNQQWTVCFWGKVNTAPGGAMNLLYGLNSGLIFHVANRRLLLYTNAELYLYSTNNPYETEEWCHFAFVFNTFQNNLMKIYVNGQDKSGYASRGDNEPKNITSTNFFRLGYSLDDIQMADFRIYAISLTQTEILEIIENRMSLDTQGNFITSRIVQDDQVLSNLSITRKGIVTCGEFEEIAFAQNIILWYQFKKFKMGEISEITFFEVKDNSLNGLNGVIIHNPVIGLFFQKTINGIKLKENSRVSAPTPWDEVENNKIILQSPQDGFSIFFKIKITDLSQTQGDVFSFLDASNNLYFKTYIKKQANIFEFKLKGSFLLNDIQLTDSYTQDEKLHLNEQEYICLTYSAENGFTFYLNNIKLYNDNAPTGYFIDESFQRLSIGKQQPAGNDSSSFEGQIGNFIIYNKELDQKQIEILFNESQSALKLTNEKLYIKNNIEEV